MMIQDIFPDVEILSSGPPDEVIAVGAALQAGLLVSRDGLDLGEESNTVEVSASDILVKVYVQIKTYDFYSSFFIFRDTM